MGKKKERNKLRTNNINIILNNCTTSKVKHQYFNINNTHTKKIPSNPQGNRNKAQITLLDHL